MSSESKAEQRGSSEISSHNPGESSSACSQGRKNNSFESIGKTTKSNQKGEELSFYEVSNAIYRPGDCVYIESQRPEVPYFICSIRDIRKSKRDHVFVNVTWFYRPCEVPTSVYQLLIHDRNHENGADHVLDEPAVRERELFISDSVDTYPISAMRGHINVKSFADVKHRLKEYTEQEDNWFYILRYNPESRRLANTKGEIRVGSNHQVKLPKCLSFEQRSQKGLIRKCPEQLVWDPKLDDQELLMYLRGARSISSFSGYFDEKGSVDKALNVLSEDSTTFHSMNVLHKCKYNVAKAFQTLVRAPLPKINERKWTDEERKLFVKGLRQYGKNFNKIRRELLPDRVTRELVHYYYVWKKTPTAINSRPHKRGRRHNVLCRKTRSTKGKSSLASEFLDLSSCSEDEPDSEDSERDLSLYACRHCYNTKSPNWHHVGKDKLLVCKICRIYFKKYGRMRPIENRIEPPSFIFKAAFENHDDDLTYSGRMRTRRSATPIFSSNGSVRTKILQEIQEARLNRILKKPDSPSTNSSGSSVCLKENNQENSRKRGRDSEVEYEEENEDEDDEEMEEKRSREESSEESDLSTESPSSVGSLPLQEDESDNHKELKSDVDIDPNPGTTQDSTFPSPEDVVKTSIKEEPEDIEYECPSSPDVPNNPDIDAKVEQRFRRTDEGDRNLCARCGFIYVLKRPKKNKPAPKPTTSTSVVNNKDKIEKVESKDRVRDPVVKNEHSPPHTPTAPAHITSQFQTALRNYWRMTGDDPRTNPSFPFMWPHFNQFVSFPHEVAGHHYRSHSPVEHNADYPSKFGHLLEIFNRHGAPIGGHSSHSNHAGHGGHTGHPSHSAHAGMPGQHPRPHTAHSIPLSGQGHTHPHPELPIPGQSPLPGFQSHHARPVNNPNLENISRTSPRPHIDPVTGLPFAYGHPHLHSHLHTHTHLHLHPGETGERHPGVPREHPPGSTNPHPAPGHPPSLPMHHENPLLRQQQELLHHLQDPRTRNALMNSGGIPTREGAISPGMLHELFRHDPAAYHLWLSQFARLHQEQHLMSDPQHHNSPHPNLRLLAEHEDYVRHLRSMELDPKFKSEHIGPNDRSLPIGERGLPPGERGFPLGERGMPLTERGLPLSERGVPRGEQFPYSSAAYLEHIRRLHGRLTPPQGKPVTIDLCED